ncbi:MAG: DUF6702 family protein [Bacteroidales bacterium]
MLKGLLWILLFQVFLTHPVHVSVTHIEYDGESGKFRISFKVFTDDFMDIILKKYGYALDPGLDWNQEDDREVISRYINESFGLKANGKKNLSLVFHGMKKNEEAVWLEYETSSVRNPAELLIVNRILLDMFHDQTNLVILGVNSFERGYCFSHQVQETRVTLE